MRHLSTQIPTPDGGQTPSFSFPSRLVLDCTWYINTKNITMSNSSMLKYLVVGLVLIYHVQSRISPLVCEKGRPLTHIQCGFPSPTSGTCPKGYYCKMHPFNNESVCCQIPCPHGDPHPTISCGMFAGSNSCPYGYTCLSHPADAYFACCPKRHG